jgi:hypothetical protein
MKFLCSFLMMMGTALMLIAQQGVGIGTAAPHSTSVLDLVSTTKGLLVPRMTASQRLSIGLPGVPATGLMVYETTSNSFWLYNGSGWVQLASGGASPWAASGLNIYNSNSGNVGIGSNNPLSKLHISGNVLLNTANPVIQLQNNDVDKGYVQLSGDNLRMGTNSGNNLGKLIIRMDGSDKVMVDSTGNMQILGEQDASLSDHGYLTLGSTSASNVVLDNNEIMARNDGAAANLLLQNDGGNVGIGNASPADKLDVDGSARLTGGARLLKMETSVAGPNGQFTIYKYAPGMQFIRADGTVLGKMEYVDTFSFSNFLRMYTGSTPTNDLTVTTDHNVGIGTADPVARLQVSGGAGEQLRIYSPAGGMLQFTSGLVSSQLKKGFMDVSGNDVRIGTNTENNAGNLIMRVNGRNSLIVDPVGTVNMPAGPDAGLTSNGLLMLGNSTSSNIVFDNNEIMARNNGAASTLILQNDGGSVRIGNVTAPADYKFAINGKMICEELKVKLASSGWPDYVFANDYQLKSLADLRRFIDQNKHLPGIPAAAEVEKNGIEVGDMQRKLMEKVEELTLYILQLEDKINRLQVSIKDNK